MVEAGVREDTDLEFKAALYGKGDSDKRELAADIAALANERGGLLILGVEETDGVATGLPGVALSEAELLRMKSSATALHAPHVPFDVVMVQRDAEPGRGYFVLEVPPSAWRPHAVRNGDRDLRFARRDGPRKRWMTESEVADLYRNRFHQASEQVDRLDAIVADAFAHVDLDGDPDSRVDRQQPWLGVALVPNNAGSMPLTFQTVRDYGQWLQAYSNRIPFDGVFGETVRAGSGMRRITGSYWSERPGKPHDDYVELHTDGSGALVLKVWWRHEANGEPIEPFVTDVDLVQDVAAALGMLANHAARTGAFGEAAVEVHVLARADLMLASELELARFFHIQAPDRNVTLTGPITSRHTVHLDDLRGPAQRRLAATRLVLTEIFQWFGSAEIRQLAPDGAIRLGYWAGQSQRVVRDWAERNGVAICDEPLAG